MYGTRMAARIDQKCADRHRTDFPFSPAMAILEHDRRLENIRLFSFEIVRIEQAIGRTTNCQKLNKWKNDFLSTLGRMFQLEHFCVGVGSREKKGLDSSKCVSALQSFYFTQLVISGAIRHICARHSFSPAAPLSIETSISPPYFRLEILKLHPFIGCTFIALSFSTNQLGTSSRKSDFHRTTPPNGRCKNSTKIWKKILINSYACFVLDTLADTYKRRWNDEWKMSKKKNGKWKIPHDTDENGCIHTHTLTHWPSLTFSSVPIRPRLPY